MIIVLINKQSRRIRRDCLFINYTILYVLKKTAKSFFNRKIMPIFAPDLVRRGRRSRTRGEYAPRGIHNKSEK